MIEASARGTAEFVLHNVKGCHLLGLCPCVASSLSGQWRWLKKCDISDLWRRGAA